MEVDGDTELLNRLASGGTMERNEWPGLRSSLITRLDKIAHNDFPIPKLPHPPPDPRPADPRLVSPLPSSSSQDIDKDADKENAPVAESKPPPVPDLKPGALPKQIQDMLDGINDCIQGFSTHPPHTIQRLAELVLNPRAHYKALAAYLHAVDRVVLVNSGTDAYPLPPAIPDMSGMNINGAGGDEKDPAEAVSWGNSTNAAVGSDEALGGALLTPIPWLTRRSPASDDDSLGAQIHSEGTETIEGPNGHTRGVTQGELLRQEQRAGVVPVNQLSRPLHGGAHDGELPLHDEQDEEDEEPQSYNEEEDEAPHARGPEEIGVGDTGLQTETTSVVSEGGGVETQGIDVAAAVGRPPEDDQVKQDSGEPITEEPVDAPSPTESTGTKREAEQELEGEQPKKPREGEAAKSDDDDEAQATTTETPPVEAAAAE